MKRSHTYGAARALLSLALLAWFSAPSIAQVIVPGSGRPVAGVGDDFEDPKWQYIANLPKSTEDLNKNINDPTGESQNGRWYEGMKRGQPDLIHRVPTPKGGLPGSEGSLLLRSVFSGIPGRPSYRVQQDDFIADVNYKLGDSISVSRAPSVVTRVYLPPFKEWERRDGSTFAFRASTEAYQRKSSSGFFSRGSTTSLETFWLGFFIDFEPKEAEEGRETDRAILRLRGDESGQDFVALAITQTGWWTFGMSFSPDGQVHYFARPGVEPLTAKDRLSSQYCYGLRCEAFNTFFFNVCSADDGKTWSTEWIVDDPTVYVVR